MITHVVEEIEHVYETVEACKDCAEDLRDAYVCLKRLQKVQPDHEKIVPGHLGNHPQRNLQCQ